MLILRLVRNEAKLPMLQNIKRNLENSNWIFSWRKPTPAAQIKSLIAASATKRGLEFKLVESIYQKWWDLNEWFSSILQPNYLNHIFSKLTKSQMFPKKSCNSGKEPNLNYELVISPSCHLSKVKRRTNPRSVTVASGDLVVEEKKVQPSCRNQSIRVTMIVSFCRQVALNFAIWSRGNKIVPFSSNLLL